MYPLTMIIDAKTQIRIHRQSEHLIVVVKNYIRKKYLNTEFVFIYRYYRNYITLSFCYSLISIYWILFGLNHVGILPLNCESSVSWATVCVRMVSVHVGLISKNFDSDPKVSTFFT